MLHVTNGDSTVLGLRRTTLGGTALPWRDALNEGPVPALPNTQLRHVRANFLSDCGWGSPQAIRADMEERDEELAAALSSRRPVVLWFEHDLYDQLQLLQILALAAEVEHDSECLHLIAADRFLGELSPAELETLWPGRRPVGAGMLTLAVAAWDAVRAPEPTAIESFLARDSSALPFLAPALRRLLEELPDAATGLARSERQLLEALRDGPLTAAQLFRASQEREEAPFDGDTWVFGRMVRLEGLLAPEAGGTLTEPPPRGDSRRFAQRRLTLTEDGLRVLAGRADAVELLGLDRWVGGTRLVPDAVWRWDGVAQRVVAA